MKRFFFLLLVFIFIILILSAFILSSLNTFLFSPANPVSNKNQETVSLVLRHGMAARSIAELLYEKKLINNVNFFLLAWRLRFKQKPFQAGEYSFKFSDTPEIILSKLISGKVLLLSITVPEGWNLFQINNRISKRFKIQKSMLEKITQNGKLLVKYGVKADSLEGFLFPDTYRFQRNASAKRIIKTMLKHFFNILTENDKKMMENLGFNVLQLTTIASIVEKETAAADERPTIAAVYLNRLKKKMRLQSDPTVIYALPNFTGNLRKSDLNYNSPYNTYRYGGLPPGPICSPGREALQAVLHPASDDYLYFVAEAGHSGRHVFSKTLREHNRAVFREQILPIRRRRHRNQGN